MHVRTSLRLAVAAALQSGAPLVSGRVYRSQSFARELDKLPCVIVSTPAETATVTDMDGTLERAVSLQITILATDSGDVEGALDGIAEQIEAILGVGDDLWLPLIVFEPRGMTMDIGQAGERTVGRMQLNYDVKLATGPGSPDTAI